MQARTGWISTARREPRIRLATLRRLAVSADVNLSPVIGVISGVLVLGEAITAATIVGGVLVLAGVLISSRRSAAYGIATP